MTGPANRAWAPITQGPDSGPRNVPVTLYPRPWCTACGSDNCTARPRLGRPTTMVHCQACGHDAPVEVQWRIDDPFTGTEVVAYLLPTARPRPATPPADTGGTR